MGLPNRAFDRGAGSPEFASPASGAAPPPAGTGAGTAPSGTPREQPGQIVADCLGIPAGASITGRSLTLLEALSSTADRRRQLEAVQAYWRLVGAVAEYRIALDEKELCERVAGRPADAAVLRTARASAAAALRAAELALLTAQYDLAEAAALSATTPPPLPADPPHVGSYRTYFDELFGGRTAPGRTRLLHRTLPVQQQAIEAQAGSVQAALDAVQATQEAYQAGEADLSTWLSTVHEWGRQRRRLIQAACVYNRDIAEYAFAVAAPQASAQALANMLIKSALTPARKPALKSGSLQFSPPSGVEPATFLEPAATPLPAGAAPATFAVPQGDAKPAGASEPPRRFVPPPNAAPLPGSGPPTPSTLRSIVIPLDQNPAGAAPAPSKSLGPSASRGATQTTAYRMVQNVGQTRAKGPLYAALAELAPPVRAKQLALALHGAPASAQLGTPIDLKQCLQGAPTAERRAAIEAYWLAGQRVAEYRAIADRAGLLEQLRSAALVHRADRGGAAAMLRVQAAIVANNAEQLGAQGKLLEAQFELARYAGRPQDAWPLPVTVPHSGPYAVPGDASRTTSAEPWHARRPAATLPVWLADLQERATATVQADAARAAATAEYEASKASVDVALNAGRQQLEETQAFLAALAGYNRAIAAYALSIVPASTSPEQLVKTLVVQ